MEMITSDNKVHTLEVDKDLDYAGNVTGTCSVCFNPDWNGDEYVTTGGQYAGNHLGDLEDTFHDAHLF